MDPYIYIYLGAFLIIILLAYVVFGLFTEGVRAVYIRYHEAERKRRIEEWERKRTKH